MGHNKLLGRCYSNKSDHYFGVTGVTLHIIQGPSFFFLSVIIFSPPTRISFFIFNYSWGWTDERKLTYLKIIRFTFG